MIGIGGLARSGKDTLAKNLAEVIEKDLGCEIKIFSLAYPLRCQIESFLQQFYHLSAFTEDEEEKKIIRPLLVAHAEQMKQKFGKDIWLEELLGTIYEDLRYKEFFPIISDVRFDFEVKRLKEEGAQIIHITKLGNQPPNEIEAKNDPLVKNISDLTHTWPAYEPDQMHQCRDHAQILWQMLKETHGQTWKKIYS